MLACNSNGDDNANNNDSASLPNPPPGNVPVTENPPTSTTPADECYLQILKRDTFTISYQQSGNMITGRMKFDNYQKDGSSGTIKGEMVADTLKLWYNFQSEGMSSVMEIYLKKENGKLIRGIGPVDVKGDTSYYTDKSAIKYTGTSYNKVDCNNPGLQ